MKNYFLLPVLILVTTVLYFFHPVFFQNKVPIPADTIVGLYHPFRDVYATQFPNGIPYKNALITDPVRQQYPWRYSVIDTEKQKLLPLWNPYSMAGTPLLGSLQSAAFYPLNILLFLLPFSIGWSVLIIVQPLLAGLFLYFYLRNNHISRFASLLGSLAFAFCGFSTAWLEWGTVLHVALWLPLLLLAIDKLFVGRKKRFLWSLVFLFALVAAFFAGHVQTFLYLFIISVAHFVARWVQTSRSYKMLILFVVLIGLFLAITFIQWMPLFQLISQSARDIDQRNWQLTEGWFIPWQHLIQFVAPDFFGNPSTLNYWGTWNYGELVGYIGLIPLLFGLFALWYRHDKKVLFFGIVFFVSLIMSLPTIFAQLPYLLHVPFLSTSQPTRLLFLTDFSLAILAALGFDYYLRHKKKSDIFIPFGFIGIVLVGLWGFVFMGNTFIPSIQPEHLTTAKRNLIFPSVFFVTSLGICSLMFFIKNRKVMSGLFAFLIAITIFDLTRFAQKFTTFSDKQYLYPQTQMISVLQNDTSQFRIMSTDSRVMPPNFSMMYRLQTIDGYDPLYLRRYGELLAASERKKPNIEPPFGFNRIVTPHNLDSRIIDLLGVKYVMSLTDISDKSFTKIMQEGETQLYENEQAFPRAFFVSSSKQANNKQQAIEYLFDKKINLHTTAIVEGGLQNETFTSGSSSIRSYQNNEVVIDTENKGTGFLVLMDTHYPTWKAKVCNSNLTQCTQLHIFQTNYTFRGVVVPSGKHAVVFYNTLL